MYRDEPINDVLHFVVAVQKEHYKKHSGPLGSKKQARKKLEDNLDALAGLIGQSEFPMHTLRTIEDLGDAFRRLHLYVKKGTFIQAQTACLQWLRK